LSMEGNNAALASLMLSRVWFFENRIVRASTQEVKPV